MLLSAAADFSYFRIYFLNAYHYYTICSADYHIIGINDNAQSFKTEAFLLPGNFPA